MKKLSKKMVFLIGIILVVIVGLSLYLLHNPKEMTRMEELQTEKERILSESEVDLLSTTNTVESTIPVIIEKTPQEILDEEEAVYQELADTSLQVYVYMEQLGDQIIEYHSLYPTDKEASLKASRVIDTNFSNIKHVVDDLIYLPKTAIYIESKRLAVEVINQYYDVASAVMDKKIMMDFPGTKSAYRQADSVDILMAQLVMKLDEEKTAFQKEHGLKE